MKLIMENWRKYLTEMEVVEEDECFENDAGEFRLPHHDATVPAN